MNPSFLNSSGIELVAFLDREGRYTWRQGYDARIHEPLRYAFLDDDALESGHPFLPSIAQGVRNQGIVLTEHGPMLLTLSPILDGNGNGPHRGAVLMGRLLAGQAHRAARRAGAGSADGQGSRVHRSRSARPRRTGRLRPASCVAKTRTRSTAQVTDVYGRHALLLRIDVPRSITRQGPGRHPICALLAADRRRDRLSSSSSSPYAT